MRSNGTEAPKAVARRKAANLLSSDSKLPFKFFGAMAHRWWTTPQDRNNPAQPRYIVTETRIGYRLAVRERSQLNAELLLKFLREVFPNYPKQPTNPFISSLYPAGPIRLGRQELSNFSGLLGLTSLNAPMCRQRVTGRVSNRAAMGTMRR